MSIRYTTLDFDGAQIGCYRFPDGEHWLDAESVSDFLTGDSEPKGFDSLTNAIPEASPPETGDQEGLGENN